jgi:hypothetical protein
MEERFERMKSLYALRAVLVLAFCLSSSVAASAQGGPSSPPRQTCQDNVRQCLQEMRGRISLLRAYVRRLKPGDPVEFNPQPDPPGSPDPWFRRANDAYAGLRAEIAGLSESSPWGQYKWTWSEEQKQGWRNAVGDASARLERVGHSPNRAAFSSALGELAGSVQRLQNDLDNGRRSAKHFRKSSSGDSGGSTTPKRH